MHDIKIIAIIICIGLAEKWAYTILHLILLPIMILDTASKIGISVCGSAVTKNLVMNAIFFALSRIVQFEDWFFGVSHIYFQGIFVVKGTVSYQIYYA